jgi:membrane protease YdiL (CAAX protease family)
MNSAGVKKPLIKQGWLRVLIFCIIYFALIIAGSIPMPYIIKSMQGNADNLVELLNGQYLWLSIVVAVVIGLIAVLICRTILDRKSVTSLGFTFSGHIHDALAGLMMAISILGIGTMILYFSNHLKWTDITFNAQDIFIEFGLLLFVAIYEELVFRGYILSNLMESFNKWIALLVTSLLFTLFHIENPNINFIPVINVFLAGILLGINYMYTRNLWFAIFFHLGWNFFQGPVLGYKISGFNMSTFLQTELKGDLLLTGGEFGFEGSVFCTGLMLIATLLLYRAYEAREQAAKFNIQ